MMNSKAKAKPSPKKRGKKRKRQPSPESNVDDIDEDFDGDDDANNANGNGNGAHDGGDRPLVPVAADLPAVGDHHDEHDVQVMPSAGHGLASHESESQVGANDDMPEDRNHVEEAVVAMEVQQEEDDAVPEANAAPLHAEPASDEVPSGSNDAPRAVGPRIYATPFEITTHLTPSRHFTLGLDQNAFRFRVECHMKDFDFPAPYDKKTFSRVFGTSITWRESLSQCHEYMWKKWNLIRDRSPLDRDEQSPGIIDEDAMKQMEEFILHKLPKERTRYGKR